MTFSFQNLFVALVASCLMCGVAYWLELRRMSREGIDDEDTPINWEAYMERDPWKRRWRLFGVQYVALNLAFHMMDWGEMRPHLPSHFMLLVPIAFLLLFPFAGMFLGALLSRPPCPYPKDPTGDEGYRDKMQVVVAARAKYHRHGQYENAWFFGKALALVTAEMTVVFVVTVLIVAIIENPVKLLNRASGPQLTYLATATFIGSLVTTFACWLLLYAVEPKTGWLAQAAGEKHPNSEQQLVSAPTLQKQEPIIPGYEQTFDEIAAEARARVDSMPDDDEF